MVDVVAVSPALDFVRGNGIVSDVKTTERVKDVKNHFFDSWHVGWWVVLG